MGSLRGSAGCSRSDASTRNSSDPAKAGRSGRFPFRTARPRTSTRCAAGAGFATPMAAPASTAPMAIATSTPGRGSRRAATPRSRSTTACSCSTAGSAVRGRERWPRASGRGSAYAGALRTASVSHAAGVSATRRPACWAPRRAGVVGRGAGPRGLDGDRRGCWGSSGAGTRWRPCACAGACCPCACRPCAGALSAPVGLSWPWVAAAAAPARRCAGRPAWDRAAPPSRARRSPRGTARRCRRSR